MNTLQDKIKIKQTQIALELDATRKQELQKQLHKLQLEKEIDDIRKRMEQLG